VTAQHGTTEQCRKHHRVQEGRSPDTAVMTVSSTPDIQHNTATLWDCH